MFLGLALFWILLNGRFSWEILGFGVAFSAALYAFACKYLGFSPREDRRALFFLPYLLPYFGLLLWELIRANFRVMGAILRPGYRPGIPLCGAFAAPPQPGDPLSSGPLP